MEMEFEIEKERLLSILSGFEVDVQHIGSTPIEDCPAKPVIDIFIGIEFLEYGEQLVPILVANGYIYEAERDFRRKKIRRNKNNE